MAETYNEKNIISFKDFKFEPELQKLKYQLLLDDKKEQWVKSDDIDYEFLKSAKCKKLIKNIPGLPKHLASHEKLLKFMESAFRDDEEIYFFMNYNVDYNVDATGVEYTEFVMKPAYVTGISMRFIVEHILHSYSNCVIDSSLIPSIDEVKTCIFVS